MRRIDSLLSSGRLLTLTGPGGIGKTRLGIEAAHAALPRHPDGVWFVDLAEVSSPDQVTRKLAWVLGQREEAGRDLIDSLVARLRYSEALLLLDNCEHVLDAASRLVATLIQAGHGLRIMCTSREHLAVSGETVWLVPPLAVPKPGSAGAPETLVEFAAVKLFFDRAEQGAAPLNRQEHAATVATICRRLDGLPLAIELAAARARVLAPDQIAARLDDRFALLVGGSPLASARQQTLRATVEWSYALLSQPEQALLRALSVFAGGFGLESAEHVAASEGNGRTDVLNRLSSLIDKSLVVAEGEGSSFRYHMLQTIREFSSDQLSRSGAADSVRRSHAEHFCAMADEAEPALHGAGQAPWLDRLEREHENLREALAWCADVGRTDLGLRMAGALWRFWYVRGYFSEGRHWLELQLNHGVPTMDAARAKALRSAAVMARVQGDYQKARAMQEEALVIFRKQSDRRGIAMTLNSLGILAVGLSDFDKAQAILGGECLDLQRELGDKRGIATCTNNLALVARARHDYGAVQSLCEASLAMYREIGFQEGVAASLLNLGFAAMFLGNHSQALSFAIESLTIYRDLGYREGVAEALEAMASIAAIQSKDVRAARLFGASGALRELVAAPIPFQHEKREHDDVVATLTARMTEAVFRIESSIGRSMSMEEAMAYAMDTGSSRLRGATRPGGLTHRELEIAALVASGLKDRDIAERLSISPRTAGKHVEHIRNKLGLRTRSELGAWASRVGLLAGASK